MKLVRISAVEPRQGRTVLLLFTDGSRKTVDLSPYLRGPIFAPILASRELFEQVAVDEEFGSIFWPNGADICPDVLFHGRTPAAPPL